MSETATAEVVPAPPGVRVGPADINEMAPWLLPKIVAHYRTTDQLVMYWLRGAVASNEHGLVRSGDAIGMAHIEPGRLGLPCRVVVDFVLCQRQDEGILEMQELYRWFARWAKSLGASGVYGLCSFSDLNRSWIHDILGRLSKTESVNVIFA